LIKEAFGQGAGIEEAKESALLSLNARPDDDVQFEIIDMPKSKVLGIFGGKEAKVRAFIELPDPKPVKKKNDKPAKAKKAEKAPKKAEKQEKKVEVSAEYKDAVPASEIEKDSPAGRACAYISSIMEKLGCSDVEVKVALKENGAMLILSGNGLGVVIGRRGETLDSLQYLTSLAANNGGGYYKVSLNIGNYRERREQTLTALAKRVSAQVISTSRRSPMRSSPRRSQTTIRLPPSRPDQRSGLRLEGPSTNTSRTLPTSRSLRSCPRRS
jgi:spoIIIJ-associated protein